MKLASVSVKKFTTNVTSAVMKSMEIPPVIWPGNTPNPNERPAPQSSLLTSEQQEIAPQIVFVARV